MDINILRSAATVAAFIAFLGVCIWAWSRGRSSAFEEAAQLPFQEEATTALGEVRS
jgi:cytochrome c oxidase cbb3-type subunit 4